MIDSDMRLIVASAKLSFVATLRPDGARNLTSDSRIEINSVDFLCRRGYRFTGTAEALVAEWSTKYGA